MKQLLSLIALTALVVPAANIGAAPAKMDIVDTAVSSKQFPTLVALVKKAGLVETLKGKGPFTVFAPTEKAFKALPKATLEKVMNDDELLKKILLYHVVPAKVDAHTAMSLDGKKADTALKDKQIKITVKDGKVMINDATVVKTDIMCTNGIIHVIDKVLMPPM